MSSTASPSPIKRSQESRAGSLSAIGKIPIGLCHSAPNIFNFPQVKLWIATCFNRTGIDNLDLVTKVAAEANEHNNGLGYPLEILTYEQCPHRRTEPGPLSAFRHGSRSLLPAGISLQILQGSAERSPRPYTFNESYVIDTEVAVTRSGSPVRALISWPSGLGDQEEVGTVPGQSKFAWSIDGKRDSEGAQQGQRQRHHWSNPTTTPRPSISISPLTFLPAKCPLAPLSSPCRTPCRGSSSDSAAPNR